MDTLGFGLRNAVPADAEAAWGARLIINMDGYVDFLADRTAVAGSAEAKASLLALLNEKLPLRSLLDIISDKIKAGEIHTRKEADVVLFDADGLKVVGNSNASCGYFYVAAFTTTTVTA